MTSSRREKILTRGLSKHDRAWEIDLLRGIPIFLVVLYHFCWSFYFFPSFYSNTEEMYQVYPNLKDFVNFLVDDIRNNEILHRYLVPFFGGTFIFICGISSQFSRNNIRRGLLLWLAALIITGGTAAASYIMEDNFLITFGVLHLMAFSVTLYALMELFTRKVLKKKEVPAWFSLLFAILIFYVSLYMASGYDPFTGTFFDTWPYYSINLFLDERFREAPLTFLTEPLGMVQGVMDWWPIFPYTGVLFLGIALGKAVYGKRPGSLFPKAKHYWARPLCFVGRHTMWVYILHQPIIFLILFIVFYFLGFRF